MAMQWNKMGHLYVPDGRWPWARKYALPPTPFVTRQGVIRIFIACCDERMVGRIGFVDVDADDPRRILRVADRPVFDVGTAGAFDENGVMPTSIVDVDGALYLYYVGYQLGMQVRYYQFEGLAISTDGGESFVRAQRVPVLDRSDRELLNRTSAFVRRRGDVFQMWYVGGSEWTVVDGKPLPMYTIKYVESADGIHWPGEGRPCIDYAHDDEHAFGRPFVIERDGRQRMFYSVRTRSRGYRIGYAEATDGQHWTRKDEEVGIDVSASGWDSEMVEYASIVEHDGRVYMFYNGNNLGETGFGYAVLEHW